MKKILWLAVFLAGLIAKAQTNENTVPFTLTESGHIIIKAEVNGVEGNFIFDTGAGLNLFFKKFAKKIGEKNSYNFFVAHRATGEALTVPIYHADELQIGNLNFSNQIYSTFDMDFGDIDGLISLQPFQNTPFTIDYENKTISFEKLSANDKQKYIDIQIANYAGKALDIFTNIKLNHQLNVQAHLDGGAGNKSFWINARLMKTLGLDSTQFTVQDRRSEFDPTKHNTFYRGTLTSIKTENGLAEVKNPKTFFVEGMIYEAKTSIEWLGKKIAISVPERKIFIIR